MNERLERALKRLDINGDGKVRMDDVRTLVEQEVRRHGVIRPIAVALCAGLLLGWIAASIA